MKKSTALLVLQLFVLVLFTFGQNRYYIFSNAKSHNDTIEITQIDTIKNNMIVGTFKKGDHYCGDVYKFDKNSQFNQSHYCCTYDSLINNGQWLVENNSTIILKSEDKSLRFCLLKLKGFYFLAPQNQIPLFVNNAQEIFSKLNKKKTFRKENDSIKNLFLRIQLSFTYFQRTVI